VRVSNIRIGVLPAKTMKRSEYTALVGLVTTANPIKAPNRTKAPSEGGSSDSA